jgi:hypothetical protein
MDINHNYIKNGLPDVPVYEADFIAKAILAKLNKVCLDKRDHQLEMGYVIAAYGLNNQMDFYAADPDMPNNKVQEEDFMEAFTELDVITKDPVCQKWWEKAQLIGVRIELMDEWIFITHQ